ncbi:hypothetical protein [Shewanella nanhaiensis]|uniref:DUF2513 domain-containing protein n=1 Tax=Shewanella nanhaiensis TaxID=2864872 RepID=A0ABS7E1K8_9GAMM|nr:hypothetical protein [Shewanella nanhaiensis]MBW8183562.1 hypothetical protein [Shewanella nanhaiensis]
MRNIELFNLSVAEILGECYESFPKRISIKESDIAYKVLEYYDDSVSDDVIVFVEQLFDISSSTIEWLEQAGYIWVGGRDHKDFYRVTLSSKGLELLNLIPDSLNTKDTLGSSFIKSAKTASKETVLSSIKVFLSEGAKLALS